MIAHFMSLKDILNLALLSCRGRCLLALGSRSELVQVNEEAGTDQTLDIRGVR